MYSMNMHVLTRIEFYLCIVYVLVRFSTTFVVGYCQVSNIDLQGTEAINMGPIGYNVIHLAKQVPWISRSQMTRQSGIDMFKCFRGKGVDQTVQCPITTCISNRNNTCSGLRHSLCKDNGNHSNLVSITVAEHSIYKKIPVIIKKTDHGAEVVETS